jgi:hypothetical protein
MNNDKLKSKSALQILGLYSQILEELCSRDVLRSVNNPAADYAEYLCCRALSLKSAPKSTKGYDAEDVKGNKYEIKARRRTIRRPPSRFSAIRKLDQGQFEFLIAVLFSEDFSVERSAIFSIELVRNEVIRQNHVNGWILPLNDKLWKLPGAEDITNKLKQIQHVDSD